MHSKKLIYFKVLSGIEYAYSTVGLESTVEL